MTVGITEARQKLSEFIERAAQGEEIIITCRGKERARLVGTLPQARRGLREIFASFGRIRMKLPQGETVKDLIAEGRRL